MKKKLLIAAIVAIATFNIAAVSTQSSLADDVEKMTCANAGCPKGPSCNTQGTANVCNLSCSDGVTVICPQSGGEDPE